MKRWISVFLLALLLTGCATQEPPASTGATDPTASSAPAETDPPESTAPQTIIDDTLALNAIPLDGAYDAVAAFGDSLLLFEPDRLTLWELGAEAPTAAAEIPNLPLPGSGLLQINDSQIVYFDTSSGTLVYLDASLTLLKKLQLNETILGDPYLSADCTKLYFCSVGGLRVWDLETGICRTLKLQSGIWQGITGAFLDETALRCQLQQEDGTVRTLLISAETGQTLREGDELNAITGSGQLYCYDSGSEWIFGLAGQQPQTLQVPGAIALPDIHSALTIQAGETDVTLELYDLDTGCRAASQQIPCSDTVTGLTAFGGYLWFFADGQLWRWDPSLSPVQDETVYTAYRYTADAPDLEGLSALRSRADALEEKYSLRILMWTDASAAEPAGYTFGIEYRTDVYEAGFAALEAALAQFPDSMPGRAASWTQDGTLYIVLVDSITTPSESVYSTLSGMEYLLDGKVCIVLELGEDLEQSFYHTLFHVIDPLVLSNSIAYYKWNDLNPSGFRYDNDYIANLDRDGSKYLDETRYFIDTFSMSFVVEDRARIFEYAMMPGNERYFESKPMQSKLKMLCKGLRDVFDLDDDSYLWEQYLQ